MHRRPYRAFEPAEPQEDDDIELRLRQALRLKASGSKFEPAHCQLVDAYVIPMGDWATCRYDWEQQTFYLFLDKGQWLTLNHGEVEMWRQRAPKPGSGISLDEWAGMGYPYKDKRPDLYC